MASYKSQYIPPRRVEDAVPTTRLPKRSITPTTSTSQLPTSSGYSKLQKRRPSRDEPAPSARALPTPTDRTREISTRQTSNTATSSSIQRPGFTSYRSASSSSRLPKLDVHVNINTRTPSLVSGSSASTIESPRSNVLRRKQPSVGITGSRHALMTRDDPMSSQEDTRSAEGTSGKFKDPFTESVFGISLPPSSNVLARSDPVFESLQHGLYDNVDPLDIYPVPTPQYALSATPSTRNADSPGAFSISSAATSMTSYSPATALSKPSYRVRQVSPLESRPPVRRQRAPEEPDSRTTHVLSTVRESSTSSSSASTVVADLGKTDLAKKRMPAVPQSHPLPGESSTRQARPRVHPVPELAHLADSSPVSLHARRPSRPSRDGTPELHGLRDPSPIIQSNMSNFPGHHRRTSSSDSKFGSLSVSRSRAAIPVKASSRNPSPIPVSSIPSTPSGLKRGTTPDDMRERDERRSSTMPGPATTVSTGKRFGLFSRRTKTDPAPQPSKVNSKLVRKGPAAGTGHEGYGRHASASRGRSSSSIGASIGRSASAGTTSESLTQTPSTRKSSMTSTTSGEMDEFFLNRLTPVILRGAGSSSELSRSPEPMNSSSSLDISTRALPMGNTSSVTAEPTNNKPRPKLLPSAMPNTMRNASPAHKPSRRPSESDDDTKRSFLPTLSSKRTSRIARPTEGVSSAPRSRSISKTRKDSASDEGSWLRTSKKAKAEKEKERPKASKWNFFSRAHGAPRVEAPAAQELNTASPGPGSRSLAHYALVDAQSSLDMKDLEELMKEAAGNTDTESVFSDNDSMRKERMQSILLPPKPIMPAFSAPSRPASPKVVLRSDQSPQRYPAPTVNTDVQPEPESSPRHSQTGTIFDLSPPSSPVTRQHDQQGDVTEKQTPAPVTYEQASRAGRPEGVTSSGSVTSSSAPRPSRLPQVGRIPKVVSSRGKARGPSSRSFSRPFVADQPRPVALPRTSFDSIGPVVATAGPVEPFPVLQGLSALCSGSAIATISPFEESRQSEFFKFPPRKDSEVSYSSSSGVWSFAPVAGTAIIPPPEAPFSDDELWNEYDDLLDEVVSPGGTTRKAGLARREPSSLEPPVLHEKSSCVSFLSGTSEQERPVSSVHLRRSRLLAALYAHQSPTSSMALSDVINDYSDRKLSVVDSTTGRLSMPLSPSLSTGSAQRRSARTSLPASLQSTDRQSKAVIASRSETDRTVTTTATRYRDTRLMDIAEAQAFGHASMADLRFAALMTSKWLSFGRVLFSPVHYQLKDLNEGRVLVIDGTGKDWSFYCALTYSDAAVYDLGPAPSSPPSKDRKSALPNHRHIRHSSLTHALPYPQNFFACVVLRFPSAQPSTTHNFLLSEAKRVLRPGGYLEFSVLDLDLVNMGNRARKAVRQLKMDIHRVDDTISLRNISDEIIAGLGRKRFVECKSCVVGVPVAGSLPAPNDVNHPMRKNSTASSRMRADSNLQPSALPKSEPSFSDLLNAPTPSETTDMGIADKVARVGRWWYSRCYESIILPDNDGPDAALSSDILKNSIWRDDNLIRECEELGTSFRMLIGYAQKPEVSLRRHVSV